MNVEEVDSQVLNLVKTRRLYTNILWNLSGFILPMIFALFCIPIFIKALGVEKFGILTIIWSITGYFNLFDMGMGRALTQKLSTCLGNNDFRSISPIIWSAIAIILVFGVLGGILLCGANFFLIPRFLKTSNELLAQTQHTIALIAFFFPMTILNIGLKGVFDSFQKFRFTSILNIFVSACNYILPIFIFPFTKNIAYIILILIVGRLVTLIFYFAKISDMVEGFFKGISLNIAHIKSLTNFGFWITVSNIIGPIMVYFDRFFIASMLSAGVVAYYTTPFEVAFRIFGIPCMLFSVLFPAFAQTVTSDYETSQKLYKKSFWLIFAMMFTVIAIIFLFAKIALSLWISPEFAQHSYRITQILIVGVFLFSITLPSFNFMQAIGRSDISAIIHLIELPFYLIVLFVLIKYYGLIGAAMAWTLRGVLDYILYTYFLKFLLRKQYGE